jgi:hypothetical protein
MTDGGKGSKPRPFSVSHQEWTNRWDAIFGRDLEKNEFQDILSTEDCVLAAFDEREERNTRNNQETQEAQQNSK